MLEGAVAIQPLYAPLFGFDEYFTGLTLEHETANPWFHEFWQKYHGCRDDGKVVADLGITSSQVGDQN